MHTKLGAERAELVQKFVPRSRVGIFRNERTRSTPLDPKLTFWCVSYYLVLSGSFGCLTKLGTKQDELVQMFVPRSRIRIFRNERTRSTPLDLKLPSFGSLTKLGAKQAELMQKFMPRSCVGIFRYECTRSTPLDPKLINLVRFVLFGCIWDRSVDLRNSVQNWPN